MGACGILECIAITLAIVFALFAVVTFAVTGIAVRALVTTLAGVDEVAAFVVGSSLSSSKGTTLILAGNMDTECCTDFLPCAASCASPSSCAFG